MATTPLGVGTGTLKPLLPASSPNPNPSGFSFTLPAATAEQPKQALPSTTSIPLPGQDQLPDSFDQLQAQLGITPPEKKPGILSTIGRGIADVALQPARFLERAGKSLGMMLSEAVKGRKLTDQEKAAIEAQFGPGLQESVAGAVGASDATKKEYATPAYKNSGEAVGGALQAAANLSVPFGTSLPAMALQGAAASGGRALEEGKSVQDSALAAVAGGVGAAALGKLLNVGGAVVGRGFRAAAPEIQKAFKPVADKLGPLLTGTTRQEFNSAFKQYPHILLDYINVVKDSSSPAEAEGILQGRLLENVRSIASAAKANESEAFSTAVKTFNDAHPDVKVDVHAVANRLLDEMPQFGKPLNADETAALKSVQEILQQPREYTVDGTRTLLQDLYNVVDRLDSNTPAGRLANQAWADVRQELSKATSAVDGGAFDKAMARYSNFKDQSAQIKQINSPNEDTARSFVRNLTGTNKTASREALIELEKMAKTDDALPAIETYRLMKRLVAEGKVTGSRVADVMVSGGAVAGLGALGALFGPGGQALGHTLGVLLAAKSLAPSTITDIMLSEIRAAGIPVTTEIRSAIEKAINDPQIRQGIINAVNTTLMPANQNAQP